MAVKKKSRRGKQHPVKANSFIAIAEQLREHAKSDVVDTNSPTALLLLIADVFHSQGKKVQKIVR